MLTNTKNVDRYLINGTPLATYSIDFPYWDKAEIKVYLTKADGTLETLVENTNYTLSTPNGNNGTLTRVGDWTAGATNLTIAREMPLTQEVDLRNGDKIDAETLEQSLDNLTAQVQQVAEAQSRAFNTPIDEQGSNFVFPNKDARKGSGQGTIMGFGSDGNSIELRDLAGFDADVQSAADNAASSEASKVKASEWASKFNDADPGSTLPVEDGKYSSRKYAYDSEQKAVVSEAKALAETLYAASRNKDSRKTIHSALNLTENLSDCINELIYTNGYDQRMAQLENNIYVITDINSHPAVYTRK